MFTSTVRQTNKWTATRRQQYYVTVLNNTSVTIASTDCNSILAGWCQRCQQYCYRKKLQSRMQLVIHTPTASELLSRRNNVGQHGMAPPYLSTASQRHHTAVGVTHLRSADSVQFHYKLRRPHACRSRASRVQETTENVCSFPRITVIVQRLTWRLYRPSKMKILFNEHFVNYSHSATIIIHTTHYVLGNPKLGQGTRVKGNRCQLMIQEAKLCLYRVGQIK